MIELTPTESIYFLKIINYKTNKQIAEELGVTSSAITMAMKKLYERTGLNKIELIQEYQKGNVLLSNKPRKKYQKHDRSEQIRLMRKLGFTDKEILEELRDE